MKQRSCRRKKEVSTNKGIGALFQKKRGGAPLSKGDYLGEFEQIVMLAVLRVGNGAYGVSIRDEIESTSGRGVSMGAIYATLARLEAKGYVTSYLGPATPERGGRPKRFIQVTHSGITALRDSRRVMNGLVRGLQRKWGIS